ncbi:cysteine desulfurase [Phytoactinopolyspora halotolerans]|uniref:cysteine desulfurase n=1 Tax=Phytoactinopolyspora halotolerans TaxID=1981512 RepID=A0A6L9SAN7_9ACTN|nr:cysteine desulfurase [Phytoactinopolyspora halotolerans]NEE02149.1 cysteine desulfurase [Phytoactinopolyspora halotolerans]
MAHQAASPLDVDRIRKDFPILERRLAGDRPLTYLDSANTSQKPRPVLEALTEHYERHNANVARAVHQLGEESTAAYEGARDKIAAFIGSPSRDEVVFAKNASEALNLVANTLASGLAEDPRYRLGPGDEIVITEMEHHSNIVPWQLVAQRTGATLRWFGITEDGRLDLTALEELVNPRTKIVSLTYQSNLLGTVNPIQTVVEQARKVGALVLVDAAQAVPHMPVDVSTLGADLLAFTGHKMCGPTGIGVLWGRSEVLAALPPFLGGGEMIETVAMEGSTFAPVPHKFEAGTPPIAQAIGLGAAVDYLTGIGMDTIHQHEQVITAYALDRLRHVEGVTIVGPDSTVERGGTISFTVDGVHPHDVGQLLDEQGVAVRVGHHCARPICVRFGIPATTRASFYLYTTTAEIDAMVDGIEQVKRFFG